MPTEPISIDLSAAARTELFERLAHFAPAPRAVLDIGGGATGSGGIDDGTLRRSLPAARIIVTHPAGRAPPAPQTTVLATLRRWWPGAVPPVERIEAAPERLPLADGSIDLVLAHWLAPGVEALDGVLTELRRVLAPGGLFLWTTPGVGGASGVAIDMHDLGSALARAGFLEPVLDIDRHRSPDGEGVIEVIHAAAFAGEARRPPRPGRPAGETVVPLGTLRRRGDPGTDGESAGDAGA